MNFGHSFLLGFLELVFAFTFKCQKIYLKSKCIESFTKIDFKQFIITTISSPLYFTSHFNRPSHSSQNNELSSGSKINLLVRSYWRAKQAGFCFCPMYSGLANWTRSLDDLLFLKTTFTRNEKKKKFLIEFLLKASESYLGSGLDELLQSFQEY